MVAIIDDFWTIIATPFIDPSVLWLLLPLVMFWLVIEIYFGKHKRESMGWNTGLANGMTITWITLDVLKNVGFTATMKSFALLGFLGYGVLIIFASFEHALSKGLENLVASPTVTYYLCAVAILWGYDVLEINTNTIINLAIIFGVIVVVTKTLQHFMHESPGQH